MATKVLSRLSHFFSDNSIGPRLRFSFLVSSLLLSLGREEEGHSEREDDDPRFRLSLACEKKKFSVTSWKVIEDLPSADLSLSPPHLDEKRTDLDVGNWDLASRILYR